MNSPAIHLVPALVSAVLCTACATPLAVSGPGMTVMFNNVIKGKKVDVLHANTSNGIPFVTPGSLGSDKSPNPMVGGKVVGAAPDGRELPEWVEFEWTEWPYPAPPKPTEPVALQAWNDRVDFLIHTLPHKNARVVVKSRVPQNVVDEVLASNKRAVPGTVPDEMLWVYFIWYETGIKFRWSLEQGCCKVLRSGGDDLTN